MHGKSQGALLFYDEFIFVEIFTVLGEGWVICIYSVLVKSVIIVY